MELWIPWNLKYRIYSYGHLLYLLLLFLLLLHLSPLCRVLTTINNYSPFYLFLNINKLDAINFIISLFQASTCFEYMCYKHVEAWNKFILKFSASSWLILRNKYIEIHGQQNIKIYSSFTRSFIHSIVFSLRGRVGRNQSPVIWPVWLWHSAS